MVLFLQAQTRQTGPEGRPTTWTDIVQSYRTDAEPDCDLRCSLLLVPSGIEVVKPLTRQGEVPVFDVPIGPVGSIGTGAGMLTSPAPRLSTFSANIMPTLHDDMLIFQRAIVATQHSEIRFSAPLLTCQCIGLGNHAHLLYPHGRRSAGIPTCCSRPAVTSYQTKPDAAAERRTLCLPVC